MPRLRYAPHVIVSTLAFAGVLLPGEVTGLIQRVAAWFLRNFDWFTLLVATGAVIFCLVIAVLPVGARRIGGPEARPEFRTVTWLSMLFAAGMGAGLVFWGAAEPLIHLTSPPPGTAERGSEAARMQALAISQFHWSLHAWSIYAVAALAVAIGTAKGNAPLPSAPFSPAPRRVRRLIDWICLGAVIFGVVASLGQGVLQIGAGSAILMDDAALSRGAPLIVVLVLLTGAYLLSAAAGLRHGIAVLSNINMVLSLTLAAFVLVAGPTADIARTLGDTVAAYATSFADLSTSLRPEGAARSWTRDWSLTYLLWWVAWTPFVGVFVARISRGRRIREFVVGVVLVPSAVTIVWFSIFGGTALSLSGAGADLGISDFSTAPYAVFVMLGELPLTAITQGLTILVVFVFLLTSADSGAYVLAMFSRGSDDPPVTERLFWGLIIAVLTAAALLSAQGQVATRAFAVTGAIPLTVLLFAQGVIVAWRRGQPAKVQKNALIEN